MNLYFQAKMVGYQHVAMKQDVRRVIRRCVGGAWRDWLELAGKILSIILCAVFVLLTGLYAIGIAIEPEIEFAKTILAVMVVISAALLIVAIGSWRRADPMKEHLWPPEAVMITVSFFEELIQVEDPYILSQVTFPAIQMIAETETAYYLFVGAEHMLMVRKREFIVGDREQFRAFISEKTGKPVEFVK